MAKPTKDRRLPSDTHTLTLTGGMLPDGTLAQQQIEVSVTYLGTRVWNIIFVGRGKTGHGIDLMFNDLGIQLSRILQGRDPREGG
jgi:hypothetical protein